jgi:tetratricopeptide (TPR) repeat protein
MHIKFVRFGSMLLLLCLCCFCQKIDPKDQFVKIDGRTITRQNFNAFSEATHMFPSAMGEFFPGSHPEMTFLIDLELLYEKAKASPEADKEKSSDDWKWKKMYFPAQLYLKQILDQNLGFSDKDVEAYYKAHQAAYKKTVKVGTDPKDTTVKVKVPQHDSTYYSPLAEVKAQIVDSLFLVKYPAPDSLLRKNPKDTTRIDTAAVKGRWVYSIRRMLPDFFMKNFYKEKFKTAFPDSMNVWYGDKKVVTPADMKVINGWIPEEQRGYYNNPAGTRELAQWLLKWKLFSEKAKQQGFDETEEIKGVIDYGWKLNVVLNYVNKNLIPAAKSGVAIDTEMCVFAYWDEHGNPSVRPDSTNLKPVVNQYVQRAAFNKVESQIFDLRKKSSVTILQNDWKDDGQQNPAGLIAKADSLRDTGNTQGAENNYRTLVTTFPFTSEGIRAYTELAKILTEKQMYTEAIKNYRDYLILSNDKSKRCNTFFMIGFIDDEYLAKPDLAQINYRWVLKNTPECELADDAEFMSLHLGEAMSSVEELRAEAMRQGKKVDTSAIQEPAIPEAKMMKTKGK